MRTITVNGISVVTKEKGNVLVSVDFVNEKIYQIIIETDSKVLFKGKPLNDDNQITIERSL